MKHLINIKLFILGMMLTFGCSDLSHDDGIDDVRYDYRVGELIAMRAGENAGSSDFPTGSLYRLFAFTQKYDNATPNPYIPATTLRILLPNVL